MDPNLPPPPDVSRGPALIIVSSVLHAISLPIAAARIWTRLRPTVRLWWDDYTILVAVAFALTNWVLILLGVRHGLGRPSIYVPLADQPEGRKFLYFGQHALVWAITFAKVSIALMLLRLRPDSRFWRVFLLVMVFLSLAIAISASGVLFAACNPLSAMWDFNPDAVCLPRSVMSQSILATATLTIVTDFVLSLFPLTFIIRMHRPMGEKILLFLLMALGLVASAASICKIVAVSSRKMTGDTLMDGVDVTFWGIIELELGIIAACVPCLRRPVEKALRTLGVLSSTSPTVYHIDRQEGSAVARNQQKRVIFEAGTRDGDRAGEVPDGWEMTPQASSVTGIASPGSWDALNGKS